MAGNMRRLKTASSMQMPRDKLEEDSKLIDNVADAADEEQSHVPTRGLQSYGPRRLTSLKNTRDLWGF